MFDVAIDDCELVVDCEWSSVRIVLLLVLGIIDFNFISINSTSNGLRPIENPLDPGDDSAMIDDDAILLCDDMIVDKLDCRVWILHSSGDSVWRK